MLNKRVPAVWDDIDVPLFSSFLLFFYLFYRLGRRYYIIHEENDPPKNTNLRQQFYSAEKTSKGKTAEKIFQYS